MCGDQLARQWRILRMLESRTNGLTAREIGHALETPIRTVYRDLQALFDAGFPLYTDRVGATAYWKLLHSDRSRLTIPFNATELMSLHMGSELLKIFEGTVFQDSIESLLSKVRSALPPEMLRYLDHISGHLRVGFSPRKNYEELRDMIKVVSDATSSRNGLEIHYRAASTGRMTVRQIDPYQVWVMNGTFYLIAFCHSRDAIRTFVLDRIKTVRVLDKKFAYPTDFKLEDYLQTAFRVMRGEPKKVKVRFAQGAAHVVKERIWHPSQEIREQRNGDIVVTLEVPINYEVISWILGFGSAAEALEPAALRRYLREEHLAASKIYQRKQAVGTNLLFDKELLPRVS